MNILLILLCAVILVAIIGVAVIGAAREAVRNRRKQNHHNTYGD
jgi:hypothetical protein